MSLERFRRTRMVVLGPRSLVYQAARAMEENHIGAVIVSAPSGLVGIVTDRDLALGVLGGDADPDDTTLEEVMSEGVVTCDIGEDLGEVARLMQEHRVRRIPLVEKGRPVGLVTLDDLILDGSLDSDTLHGIVRAQLEVEALQKPAGALHPRAATTAESRVRALMRARARAEATYANLVQAVSEATGLDRGRAERALFIGTCMLCRRLTPDEGRHLIAQLPSQLRAHLEECLRGPDRSVTTTSIEEELARSLGIDSNAVGEMVRALFAAVSRNVSAGQITEVRGQLPEEMKGLFPAAA